MAGGLGFGVSLLCLLPPIIHFCSGPLGPAIGGYVAGARVRAQPRQGVLIGLVMGGLAVIPLAIALGVHLANPQFLPGASPGLVALGALLLLAWVAGLGTLGAVLGGRSAREG